MSLLTDSAKAAYLSKALRYAAAHADEKTRFAAMVDKYPEKKLSQCMSISSVRRRVKAGSTDGTITKKGGSRKGSGRKQLPPIVLGEKRKNSMDRLRIQTSRLDEQKGEETWREITFKPFVKELPNTNRAVNCVLTLASAAKVCFDSNVQDASPIYKHGLDLSYVCDLADVNPLHGTPTTGQQRRLLFPTDRQRHKENMKGQLIHAPIFTPVRTHTHTHAHTIIIRDGG